MATSPNFGWLEPDNTDLVKNGALAIRTAVNAIDASMADLKGGTTGQVLTKASNTDMDFSWVADATGIPATIIDAKGDLIAGTAADTASRLAVGTNGQVLTADSTAATGLKWAAAGGSSLPSFRATRITSDYTIPSANTFTKMPFNGEDWDTASCYDSTTNFRFTPNVAGYYQINSNCSLLVDAPAGRVIWTVYKNGSGYARIFDGVPPASSFNIVGSVQMYFNGTTDYAEMYIWTASSSTRTMPQTVSYLGNTFDGVGIRS